MYPCIPMILWYKYVVCHGVPKSTTVPIPVLNLTFSILAFWHSCTSGWFCLVFLRENNFASPDPQSLWNLSISVSLRYWDTTWMFEPPAGVSESFLETMISQIFIHMTRIYICVLYKYLVRLPKSSSPYHFTSLFLSTQRPSYPSTKLHQFKYSHWLALQ